MDDDLRRWLSDTASEKGSGDLDPPEIRRLARRRRAARRGLGGGAALAAIAFAVVSWPAGTPDDEQVRVIAPPEQTTTSTTELDPPGEPDRDQHSSTTTTWAEWDDAPEACASPGLAALRADLSGDGSREHIAYFDVTLADGTGSQVLRICAGDQVWERQGQNTSLLTVLRVGDRWFLAWGGTSGGGRHQTLLALADGELVDALDQDGEPMRLTELLRRDESLEITRWWGCEDDLLASAEREPGTSQWTVTRYRWDPDGGHMVRRSTEVRTHDPRTAEPSSDDEDRSYRDGIHALSDVLPPACEGADSWGHGGVPRTSALGGELRWLGWPNHPGPAELD